MAVTTFSTSTKTVSTAEWSLAADASGPTAQTTAGFFGVRMDLNLLASGDTFTFKFYEKVISGGTQRALWTIPFIGAQPGAGIFMWPPMMLSFGWDFTLIKTAGTDRSITFSILQG